MTNKTKAIMRFISLVALLIFIGNINTAAVQAAAIESIPPFTTQVEKRATKPHQIIYVDRTTFLKDYGDDPFSLGARAKGQLSYQSSDTNVVVVSDDGTVTIIGAGTAEIAIQAAETERYASTVKTVTVTVDKACQDISIPKDSFSKLYGNKPFSLKAKAETPLSYKTSNAKIATVNPKGFVTIKGVGTVKITITAASTNQYEGEVLTVDLQVDLKVPKLKVKRVGRSAVKLSWTKVPGTNGYRILAGTVSNVRKDKKNKDLLRYDYKEKLKKTSAKKRSAVYRNLKRGSAYVYMVQAYRKVGKKTVYGQFSEEKVVRNGL